MQRQSAYGRRFPWYEACRWPNGKRDSLWNLVGNKDNTLVEERVGVVAFVECPVPATTA